MIQVVVSVHLENCSITRAVLTEVVHCHMDHAFLRRDPHITQVAPVDHNDRIRVEVVGARIGIVALLHVVALTFRPNYPWLLR